MKYILIAGLLLSISIQSNAQQDPQEIWALKLLAVKNNDADAQCLLGGRYAEGIGVLENDKDANAWYFKAAVQGHAGALLGLGRQYLHGEGVLRNKPAAYAFFSLAIHQGFPGQRGILELIKRRMTFQEIKEGQECIQLLVKEYPGMINKKKKR